MTGFIGLGRIGAAMASRIPAGELVVCDVSAEATRPFAEAGARVAATPGDVARQADVVCVMVRDDEQVREVCLGPQGIFGAAHHATVVAIHSTISVETATRVASHDVAVVDAPVSGGPMGAHDGTLAVMAGGDAAAVEACRPVFERFASLVVHAGNVGAGTEMKLARNLMHFVAFVAAAEAQRLAEAVGLDLQRLGEVVRHSDRVTGGPGAVMIRPTAATMAADDPLRPIFEHTTDLGSKDLQLALDLGRRSGVDLPLAELALAKLAAALGVA